MVFFCYALLFMIGSVSGWVIELFFRRFFSAKKWINPGFLNGPYLPMYGFGVCILYAVCSINISWWWKLLIIVVFMTLIEYVTGLIFIVGMKIRLWDYSDRWGNIQGIICPLFSFFWGVLGAAFMFLIYPPLLHVTAWLYNAEWFLFIIGLFFGVMLVDLCISLNVSVKIRAVAVKLKEVVHYEELKATLKENRIKLKKRASFLFPFSGGGLKESIEEHFKRKKSKKSDEKKEN